MKLSEAKKRVGRFQARLAQDCGRAPADQHEFELREVMKFISGWDSAWGRLDHTLVLLAYEGRKNFGTYHGPAGVYAQLLMGKTRRAALEWRAVLELVLDNELTVDEVTAAGFRNVARYYPYAKGSKADKLWEVSASAGRRKRLKRKQGQNWRKSALSSRS